MARGCVLSRGLLICILICHLLRLNLGFNPTSNFTQSGFDIFPSFDPSIFHSPRSLSLSLSLASFTLYLIRPRDFLLAHRRHINNIDMFQ